MDAKRLQQELSGAKTEISLLKQELQAAKDEIDRLEAVNSNLMTFTAQASTKSADEGSRLVELELQISELKTQKETIESDLSRATATNLALQTELQAYQLDNNSLRCNIAEYNQQFSTLASQRAGAMPFHADEVAGLRQQVVKLEQALEKYKSASSEYTSWEERCYRAESRITELEVLLAGAEKHANMYHETQRLLEHARAELAHQASTTGQSPRELEDLLAEYKTKLVAANEHNKRISEQYDKLLEIRNKQDEKLKRMGEMQRQNDTFAVQIDILNAELAKLRLKEKEYSNILSSVDSHNIRNDERIRELEQRHRLEMSRREEVIAGLREDKSRLVEQIQAQKSDLRMFTPEQRMFARVGNSGSFDPPARASRPMSAQLQQMSARSPNLAAYHDDPMDQFALNTSRHRSRPSTALKATTQLRLASRTLRNIMN